MAPKNIRGKVRIVEKYLPLNPLTPYELIDKQRLELIGSINMLYELVGNKGQSTPLQIPLRNIHIELNRINNVNTKQKIKSINQYWNSFKKDLQTQI